MATFKVTGHDQYGNEFEHTVTAQSMHVEDKSLVFLVDGSEPYNQELVQAYAPGQWETAKRV